MLERLRSEAAWHTATAARLLRAAPPWVLLVPAAGALLIWLLDTQPAIAPYLVKESAERASPIVLGAALAAAAGLAAVRQHVYFVWQALFALALFLRELHFQGTNTAFYIAVVALLWWASHARGRMEPFISDRRIVTPMMAVLWTYLITKTLDRHYWDGLLPAGITNDLFEENLELLGHGLFLVLVVVSAYAGAAALSASRSGVDTG